VGDRKKKEGKQVKKTAGYIAVEFVITKEGDQYSSWCPDLDIASCGDTPEDAARQLGDAVDLYLGTLEKDGELEQVIEERGIRLVDTDEPVIPNTYVTQYRQKVPV